MKRLTAILLALALLLSVQVSSFAIIDSKGLEETEHGIRGRDPRIYDSDYDSFIVNDTDIMETENKDTELDFDKDLEVVNDEIIAEYTEYNYRDELDYDKKKILEDAYRILDNAIDQKYGALSVYWTEAEFLPYTIVFKIREFDRAEGFTYLEYKDDKWQPMEHEFDKKNEKVILKVSVNGPIAICYSPGGSEAIMESLQEQYTYYDSVEGRTIELQGSKAGSLPARIHKEDDVVTVAVDQSYMLTEVDWDVFNKAYKELKDQIPEGMTARYFFWLQEEKPSDVDFTLEDIKSGDTVICKLFDGSDWKEQKVEIPEDGLVNVFFEKSGAALILTEIQALPE